MGGIPGKRAMRKVFLALALLAKCVRDRNKYVKIGFEEIKYVGHIYMPYNRSNCANVCPNKAMVNVCRNNPQMLIWYQFTAFT
jgi:hypothetical protein